MSKEFYMVYVEGSSGTTKQHTSLELAEKEAERLALKHPGNRVFILQPIKSCINSNVVWSD